MFIPDDGLVMDIYHLNRRDILNYQRRRAEERQAQIIPAWALAERRQAHHRDQRHQPVAAGTTPKMGEVIRFNPDAFNFDLPPGAA